MSKPVTKIINGASVTYDPKLVESIKTNNGYTEIKIKGGAIFNFGQQSNGGQVNITPNGNSLPRVAMSNMDGAYYKGVENKKDEVVMQFCRNSLVDFKGSGKGNQDGDVLITNDNVDLNSHPDDANIVKTDKGDLIKSHNGDFKSATNKGTYWLG